MHACGSLAPWPPPPPPAPRQQHQASSSPTAPNGPARPGQGSHARARAHLGAAAKEAGDSGGRPSIVCCSLAPAHAASAAAAVMGTAAVG